MSIKESYLALSRLLRYPEIMDESLESCNRLGIYYQARGLECPAAPFAAFLRGSTLSELQEDYVATFDFNPKGCLYLGHHLHGDNQKKGAYMIGIKQEFGRHDFIPEDNELPDHLAVLVSFLAHLARRGEDSYRREFISQMIAPGLGKMVAAEPASRNRTWQSLIETAQGLCTADCKEAPTC